jgi:hypothetical protein
MRLSLTVAIGVLALALASPAAALSKSEFIRRGDALCVQTKRALVPIQARAQAAKSLPTDAKWRATADIWADQIVIQRRFVTRFRAIGTPAGDRAARNLVSGMGRGLTLAANVQGAFARRDTIRLPTYLSDYLRFTLSLNRRVVAYGFRACGR